MVMGINTAMGGGGGNFLPVLKYNSQAGRMFRSDRTQDAGGKFVTIDTELREPIQLVWDFGTLEVGWALFAAGKAPAWSVVPHGQKVPPQPAEQFRDAFRMKVWNPNVGVREFGGATRTLTNAVDEIHTLFEHAPEAAQGKVPVVLYAGAMQVKGQQLTTYRPQFEIVRWVDRPVEFGERIVAPPTTAASLSGQGVTTSGLSGQGVQPTAARQFPPNPRHAPPPPMPAAQPQPQAAIPMQAPTAPVDEWGGDASNSPVQPPNDSIDDEIPF